MLAYLTLFIILKLMSWESWVKKKWNKIYRCSSFYNLNPMLKIILKPLSPREVCDDQIIRREKREQERDNSEAPQRNRKRKSDTLERWSDTQERERVIILIS